MKSKQEIIPFVLIFVIFSPLSLYFAYKAWTEQQLRQELTREGISTQAIVQECLGNRAGCSVKYQFEASLPGQQVKSYQVEETYVCFGCQEGTLLPIRFLPRDPTKAGIEGRNNTSWYILLSICGFGLVFFEGIRFYKNTRYSKKYRIVKKQKK